MLPEPGEVLTVEVHRISNNGNGIHEINSDYSINLGKMKEQAIGKEITVKMVNKKFARPVRHLESALEVGSEVTSRVENLTSDRVPVMVSDGVNIEVADDSVELGEKRTVTIVEMWEGIDGLHAEGIPSKKATIDSEDGDDISTQIPLNKKQSSPTSTSSKKVSSSTAAEKDVDTEEEINPLTGDSPARLTTDETIETRERIAEQRIRKGQDVFRRAVRSRYADTCVLCEISEPTLLEAAHICSWSDHQTSRGDPANGLLLCPTHHRAFDKGLFTLTTEYELIIDPNFKSKSSFMQRTIFEKAGNVIDFPKNPPGSEYLANHNETDLDWWSKDGSDVNRLE